MDFMGKFVDSFFKRKRLNETVYSSSESKMIMLISSFGRVMNFNRDEKIAMLDKNFGLAPEKTLLESLRHEIVRVRNASSWSDFLRITGGFHLD